MEDEIAAIFVNFVRSISAGTSVTTVLNRIHVLRNSIVLHMDWREIHCPLAVANHMLIHLGRENMPERKRLMAVVCDLVFSSLIGHDSFFTHFVARSEVEDTAPYGPF
jgi:hypothetical protein